MCTKHIERAHCRTVCFEGFRRRIGPVMMALFFLGISPLPSQVFTDHRVPIELDAKYIGTKDLEIVFKDSTAYLPAVETFTFLGIKASFDTSAMLLRGFYKSPDTEYVVDAGKGKVQVGKRGLPLTDQDYLISLPEMYLRIGLINDMFDLDFTYTPRRLRVELHKIYDLPAFQAAQRKRRMQQLAQRRFELEEPAVIYGREVEFIGGERLDWNTTFQYNPATRLASAHYTLALGSQFMGSDVTANLVGSARPDLYTNDLRGQARFPVFNTSAVRQVIAGDFVTSDIQPRLVTGVEITNRPFTQRILFTREVFHGQFEPGADIELSGSGVGNRVLQSDMAGSYQFDFPTLYGQGILEVRAYDPWGQVSVTRYRMNVPRDVLPEGEMEYSLSSGRIRPPVNILQSSNYIRWGVSSNLTVGAKLDYEDLSNTRRKFYGAITATSVLFSGLAFNAMVAPSAFSQAAFDWIFPSNADLSLIGTHYSRNLFFNPTQEVDDIQVRASAPIDRNSVHLAPSLLYEQLNYESYRDRLLQAGLSAIVSIFSPSINTEVIWHKDDTKGATVVSTQQTNASVGIPLPAGAFFVSGVTYDHLEHRVQPFQAQFIKRFPSSFQLVVSYIRNAFPSYYNIGLRIDYYFPFTRARATASTSGDNQYLYSVAGSGSVAFDPKTTALYFEDVPTRVGFGGVLVRPFLDMNGNGKMDKGEPVIEQSKVIVTNLTRDYLPSYGGGTLFGNRLLFDRTPGYEEYNVYLDPQSLEDPIWVPEYSSVQILSEPNHIRRIDFPVVSGGTVRGNIKISDGITQPAEAFNVIMTLITNGTKRRYVRKASSFSSGEFEFSQVPPGAYRVELDASQLQTLRYFVEPTMRQVEVTAKPEGDVVIGVDFVLKPR